MTNSSQHPDSTIIERPCDTGKGLGKDENGITDAIKSSLKQDTAGLGHDYGKEFTDSWWNRVFDKAASNLVVESSDSGVHVMSKGTDNPTRPKNKASSYGNFVKGAVLDGITGVETPTVVATAAVATDVSPRTKEPGTARSFTDEELMSICGGRTAHKAARHGFKLDGKLQRIEEQERLQRQRSAAEAADAEQAAAADAEQAAARQKKRKRLDAAALQSSEDGGGAAACSASGVLDADSGRQAPANYEGKSRKKRGGRSTEPRSDSAACAGAPASLRESPAVAGELGEGKREKKKKTKKLKREERKATKKKSVRGESDSS